jgi:hypothetical protein
MNKLNPCAIPNLTFLVWCPLNDASITTSFHHKAAPIIVTNKAILNNNKPVE